MHNSNLSPADKLKAAQGLDAESVEADLWEGGYSGKNMLGSWILAALVTVLILVAVFKIEVMRTNSTVWLVAAALIGLLWLSLFSAMIYQKWSRHYQLTTQRLRHRNGIIIRKMDRIELIDIDDVTYRQGPIQTLMDVGNIQIKSSDTSHPELTMYGISSVRQIADLIDDARRAERRKRGLHIEAI